jgi:hypothetical protein
MIERRHLLLRILEGVLYLGLQVVCPDPDLFDVCLSRKITKLSLEMLTYSLNKS